MAVGVEVELGAEGKMGVRWKTQQQLQRRTKEMPDIAVKVATIALLTVRYAAAMALYCAVVPSPPTVRLASI